MTRSTTITISAVATLLLLVAILIVALVTKQSNPGFSDPTATITFVTGAAIAIERMIELIWTILGNALSTYWPLNVIRNQVDTMVKDLDRAMVPFHENLSLEFDQLAQAGKMTEKELLEAKEEIRRMKERFDDLIKLTPDNQRMQLLAAAASQNVAYMYEKYNEFMPNLEGSVRTANAAINGLQDFLASFKDNPGKRIISIYLGATIGLVVAGIFSLDVFQAVLNDSPAAASFWMVDLRVIVTGLVIGLGSGPTHEVIRVVQEYKENRKSENIMKPDLPPR